MHWGGSSSGVSGGYTGLGPISQYGWNPNGTASLGPWAMLPGAGGGDKPMMPGGGGGGSSTTTSTMAPRDPATQAAMDYLQGVMGGQNEPMGQATQDNMYSEASDQNAASEAANVNRGREDAVAGGASASDPTLQAYQRQEQARRQTSNSTARRGIETTAALKNFEARSGAASELANLGTQREIEQNRQRQYDLDRQERQRQSAQGMLSGYFRNQNSFGTGPMASAVGGMHSGGGWA